jgi:hypothetical protein
VPRLDTCIRIIESTGGEPRDLFEGIGLARTRRWDEKGWFTIAGLDGAVDVRPPLRKVYNRLRETSAAE